MEREEINSFHAILKHVQCTFQRKKTRIFLLEKTRIFFSKKTAVFALKKRLKRNAMEMEKKLHSVRDSIPVVLFLWITYRKVEKRESGKERPAEGFFQDEMGEKGLWKEHGTLLLMKKQTRTRWLAKKRRRHNTESFVCVKDGRKIRNVINKICLRFFVVFCECGGGGEGRGGDFFLFVSKLIEHGEIGNNRLLHHVSAGRCPVWDLEFQL